MPRNYTIPDFEQYLKQVIPQLNGTGSLEEVVSDIIKKCERAMTLLDLSFSELLAGLDYQQNNYQVDRLEALLAELRSIFWLDLFGFSEIELLTKKKKVRNPDFSARYHGRSAAIEVFCLTQTHQQAKDPQLGVWVNFSDKLEKAFSENINNRKKSQLSSYKSELKVMLCVVNSEPIKYLNRQEDFISLLKSLHDRHNMQNSYKLGVVTGLVNLATGKTDDCIYPPIN